MRYGSIAYDAVVSAEPRALLEDLEHLVRINIAPAVVEWKNNFPAFQFERQKSTFWHCWTVGGIGNVEREGARTRLRLELFVDYPRKQMVLIVSYLLLVIGCATAMIALRISEPWQMALLVAMVSFYLLLGFLSWKFRHRCFALLLRTRPDVASKEIEVINDCLWKYNSRLVELTDHAELRSDRQVAT